MQSIWEEVFVGCPLGYVIVPGTPMYRLCMQKIYDWRSAFGSNAVQAVVRFWVDSEMLTTDQRAEAAAFAIGDSWPYLYGRVTLNDDGSIHKRYQRFQSLVIIEALAGHMRAIDGAPAMHNWPLGALLLATAATERAWTIGLPGKIDKKAGPAFSEKHWSARVPFYLRSIENLTAANWTDIMTKANETLNMLGSNPPESETFDGEDDYMLSDIESSAGSDQDEDE
ncbi:hypothetical protein C8Q72DRAFT_306251 [Fomitopsis betulina]|nr:hypothetical protein C8Q72DRAFT_306251 [Fomitopsis betulina]